ncbi:hypothetical protein Ais01nite_63690 [Asanoa ishikariensis]|uniref:hypothetical protein n=1 Tax=Asanoa ishikariensis TaxID=137265 RepID=UPI000B809F38|nr:hypothetical protein [Asanoa ishikariensis]GIF68334.1 hypothetical protein Ais01nite_63690 [Asanoa ishikariensis]
MVAAGFMFAATGAAAPALAAQPTTVVGQAPKAPKPTGLTLTSEGMGDITVTATEKPQLFADLLKEVSFLGGTMGQITAPKAAALGRKFTVVVRFDDKPRYSYDLYPLAKGGPKAFRPAAQPDKKKTTAAWFLGRMTMSEALRIAGAPIPQKPDVMSGGIGGGERVIPEDSLPTGRDLDTLLAELRQLVLLNGGVVLVLTFMVAGVALIIRHRTR